MRHVGLVVFSSFFNSMTLKIKKGVIEIYYSGYNVMNIQCNYTCFLQLIDIECF